MSAESLAPTQLIFDNVFDASRLSFAVSISELELLARAALAQVSTAAREEVNLVLPILAAVEAHATVGEISDALRDVFGQHRDTQD